jgi:hypothetical protein
MIAGMDQFNTFIIGQPSLDINTDHDYSAVREIGGAVVYSGFAAAALGHKVCVLPKANSGEIDMAALFAAAKNVTVRPMPLRPKYLPAAGTGQRRRRFCTAGERRK